MYEERKDLLVEPAQRFLHQIIVDSENMAKSIKKKVNFKNLQISQTKKPDLMQMISTGLDTKNELPDEIIDATFKLNKGDVSVNSK